MKFYEYGSKSDPIVLFFHAAITNPAMYKGALTLLSQHYYVIAPEADGHSLSYKTDFISINDNVKKIEEYLLSRDIRNIHGLYGVSMGGAFALRFLADEKIKVGRIIIDAGITPYEFSSNKFINYIMSRGALLSDTLMIIMLRHAEKSVRKNPMISSYSKDTVDGLFRIINNMTLKSAVNVFDSTNNYPMPNLLNVNSTDIQYWYGSKEAKERKGDIKNVQKFVPGIKVREFKGYQHAEFILEHAEKAVTEIIKFFESK